ncbi:hypothetical protein [Microtetraspora sp. NBRC 13810]|uniref:hypothetical protein n=1 Tax=Microtetraspora sp. NBRC 13810 TaxID=3030990 RepID=UPI002552AAE1|nr:hypothetical protein [Microtetraspora sp. NBRC 13810]
MLSSFLKGSGSLASVGRDPASGRPVTAQSAPSFSTPAAAAASGGRTVSAPATESVAAIASATTLERIGCRKFACGRGRPRRMMVRMFRHAFLRTPAIAGAPARALMPAATRLDGVER